jgi:hypothetical protein
MVPNGLVHDQIHCSYRHYVATYHTEQGHFDSTPSTGVLCNTAAGYHQNAGLRSRTRPVGNGQTAAAEPATRLSACSGYALTGNRSVRITVIGLHDSLPMASDFPDSITTVRFGDDRPFRIAISHLRRVAVPALGQAICCRLHTARRRAGNDLSLSNFAGMCTIPEARAIWQDNCMFGTCWIFHGMAWRSRKRRAGNPDRTIRGDRQRRELWQHRLTRPE